MLNNLSAQLIRGVHRSQMDWRDQRGRACCETYNNYAAVTEQNASKKYEEEKGRKKGSGVFVGSFGH
jgi:hypothetical protein